MKENENDFAFIFFHFLAGNSLADCIRGLRPAPPTGADVLGAYSSSSLSQ
jgi:hypothetical protein